MYQKLKKYFSEVWGEVKWKEGKVSWPTREEVKGSTVVVVVTVGIAAVYLFGVDLLAGWIMSMILGYGS